jgi:hypothetical protein
MTPKFLLKSAAILVTSVLLAPGAFSVSAKTCPLSGPVTERSYHWNFRAEASDTFAALEREARRVSQHVSALQALARFPGLYSPESHAYELTLIRDRVNSMGEDLCRLREIQPAISLAQQSRVRQLETALTGLALDTQAALNHFNARNTVLDLSANSYTSFLDGMYQSARALSADTESGHYE